MEGWQIAILLKPFGLVAFLFLVAVLALPLRRYLPKNVLTDPTFRDRHPFAYGSAAIGLWICLITYFAWWSTRL